VPVQHFTPKRSQRRIWQKSRHHTRVITRPPVFDEEHFQLFSRYLQQRHPEGEMASSTEEDYRHFLLSSWSDTRLIEFRREETLVAVAVTDFLPKGLSAVYTFFDPEWSSESPGVYSILWQIQEAQNMGLLWLYLGFWIPGCQKMAYKEEYRPIQLFRQDQWREFSAKTPIPF
jgi:arginine-tRNA-protein transferase